VYLRGPGTSLSGWLVNLLYFYSKGKKMASLGIPGKLFFVASMFLWIFG
jgi:hypothetical protein